MESEPPCMHCRRRSTRLSSREYKEQMDNARHTKPTSPDPVLHTTELATSYVEGAASFRRERGLLSDERRGTRSSEGRGCTELGRWAGSAQDRAARLSTSRPLERDPHSHKYARTWLVCSPSQPPSSLELTHSAGDDEDNGGRARTEEKKVELSADSRCIDLRPANGNPSQSPIADRSGHRPLAGPTPTHR